jgi:anthranilate synthase/aminodeoxychorismate synthase-like glutamine amidotransferase
LVIDHHDSYTYNLVHLIATVTGDVPEVIQHDDPIRAGRWRDGFTHVVLSPGPGTVRDHADFALGRKVIADGEIPVLGVCLGMQGIVDVLGGNVDLVEPAHGEIAHVIHDGTGIFTGIPQGFAAVRYHSQAAVTLPDSLRATAWCDGANGGQVVMGVEHRTRSLHGVQFHPESVLTEYGAQLIRNFVAVG